MFLVTVDTARRQKAQEVHRLVMGDGPVHGLDERVVGEECPALDGAADAGEFLVDHPAGSEVEVTHLGIAHLLRRQADIGTGTADQQMGAVMPQAIPYRGFGVENGVGFAAFTVTPAVEYD